MKKILIFVIILVGIFGIILFLSNQSPKYTEISYEQLIEKLNNKDTFVLLIGSDTCSACANYEITMKKVMKDTKVEIFYVNLHTLLEEDYNEIFFKDIIFCSGCFCLVIKSQCGRIAHNQRDSI